MSNQVQVVDRQERVYGALVAECIEHPLVQDDQGFVRLKGDPKKHRFQTDGVRGMAPYTLGKTLTALKRGGRFDSRRAGSNDWSWWIKPPEGSGDSTSPAAAQLSLDSETSPRVIVERLNRLLRLATDKLEQDQQEKARMKARIQELEAELADARQNSEAANNAFAAVEIPKELAQLLQED